MSEKRIDDLAKAYELITGRRPRFKRDCPTHEFLYDGDLGVDDDPFVSVAKFLFYLMDVEREGEDP